MLPHEFLLRQTILEWAPDDFTFQQFRDRMRQKLATAGIDPSVVDLIIVAKSSYLKLANIVFSLRVSELESLPRKMEVSPGKRAEALSAPFTGFDLEVALVLARGLPKAPLKPFRKGTWLSRIRFGIDTKLSHVIFSPIPLTSEIRKTLQLRPKAMRFVDFDGYDFVESPGDQEVPKFYVDADLLAQLNARRSSAIGRAIQVQLAVDFVTAVIQRASELEDKRLNYEDVRSSILGSVVRMLANASAGVSELNGALAMILDSPARAIADIDHVFNASGTFAEALNSEVL